MFQEYLELLDPQQLAIERLNFTPIIAICEKFANGTEGHTALVLKELFGYYLQGEKYFQYYEYDKCVSSLLAEVRFEQFDSPHFGFRWCLFTAYCVQ